MTGNSRTRPLRDSLGVLTDLPLKKEAVFTSLIAIWGSEAEWSGVGSLPLELGVLMEPLSSC